jgi:hypothetical protein
MSTTAGLSVVIMRAPGFAEADPGHGRIDRGWCVMTEDDGSVVAARVDAWRPPAVEGGQ